jgi:hypothetical protein
MKKPEDFKKSYALVQIGSIIVYVLVGSLIYVFGGQVSSAVEFSMSSISDFITLLKYTTSPALTMTSHPVSTTALVSIS